MGELEKRFLFQVKKYHKEFSLSWRLAKLILKAEKYKDEYVFSTDSLSLNLI